jgi:hypothetical protein
MKHEVAGDPVSGLKWTRKTTQKIAEELQSLGIDVGKNTVARLLKDMDFSLKANQKKIAAKNDPDRDEQFKYISMIRDLFEELECPVISVDTKKKEMIGLFKNPGSTWAQAPTAVNDHDFRSLATGIAIPYAIYDTVANLGFLFVGISHDTPEFAVDCIEKWWRLQGIKRYPDAPGLLILADSGGSNGCRSRAWKRNIQENLCDKHGLMVTVSHYPPGTSKWNPIEHRLLSEISKNWAGKPLDSYETILRYARTTQTSSGLKVKSYLVRKEYEKRKTISDEQMKELNLATHAVLPQWNYTVYPREHVLKM